MELLPFILNNWDLVSLAIVAMLILGYDLFIHIRGKEPPSEHSYLVMILIAIGLLSMHTAREAWKEQSITTLLDHVEERLAKEHAADHPYLKAKIKQDLEELEEAFRKMAFHTSARQDELTRAMNSTQEGDKVFAIDHGIDWDGDFRNYQIANGKAIKRGVDIQRIFLLPNSDLPLQTRKKILAAYEKTLPEQADNQIKVWVADEEHIDNHKECKFDQYKEGSVLFEYKGKKPVVMFEKKRPDELEEGESYPLTVTWDQTEVHERRELFDCLIKKVANDFSHGEGQALLATAWEHVGRDHSQSVASR